MITAAGTMKPLPVRPVDGIADYGSQPVVQRPVQGVVRPLPVPTPEPIDLVDALRTTAFERMLDRLGVQQPLPVHDPTA